MSASPLRMIVGTTVSRSGPAGSCSALPERAASARASSALTPLSGAEPECAERPRAVTLIVPAALRRTITASSPDGPRSPASKHRHASKSAKRGPCSNAPDPPLLVVDEQQQRLAQLGALGQRAQHPERDRDSALHVDRPAAAHPPAMVLGGDVRGVRHDGVQVADEQDPPVARPADAQLEVRCVTRRGTGDARGLGDVRRQRGRDGDRLLRAGDVAGGRGDRDQRLEVALGPRGERRGVRVDPLARHQATGARPCARAAASTIASTSGGESTIRSSPSSRSVSIPRPTTASRSQAISGSQ